MSATYFDLELNSTQICFRVEINKVSWIFFLKIRKTFLKFGNKGREKGAKITYPRGNLPSLRYGYDAILRNIPSSE